MSAFIKTQALTKLSISPAVRNFAFFRTGMVDLLDVYSGSNLSRAAWERDQAKVPGTMDGGSGRPEIPPRS
jgi:hypothetical protein